MTAKFQKDKTAFKMYCLGAKYHTALKALGLAEIYHVGTRKDGVTHEFHHQIRICFSLMNLKDINNLEKCLTLALIHDLQEDYPVSDTEIRNLLGDNILETSMLLNKNNFETSEMYFASLAKNPEASLVKGADNCDNIQSMHGAFSEEKIHQYITRTQNEILPMLKQASKFFPEQSHAYSALRVRLKDSIDLYNGLFFNV